jgi:glucose/arabinose dehydrogenase
VLALVTAAAALYAAGAAARRAAAAPRVTVVAGGLEAPWALAFAPDGRLFVTERPGRLRVVRDGRLERAPVATLPVVARGESGLMGLALAPDFARSGRLYVCYTARAGRGTVNRLVRYALRDGRLGDEHVVLDGMRAYAIHDGCRVKIGPDGKLWATMGDAGQPALAQERDSRNGKILRLNLDGSVPDDNPFRGSPVFSYGHRNPQGLAWSAGGRLVEDEHGPVHHDEINAILPGRNYGWPEAVGIAHAAGFVDPLAESGNDTWAPSGSAFLGDHLYIAALRGERLLRVTFDAGGGVARIDTALDGYGRLRDVVAGPDGALYVATCNRDGRGDPARDDDRILRVTP